VILHGARATLRANSGGANSTVSRMGENADAPFVCRQHSLEVRRWTVFASWLTGPAVIGRWGRIPTLELRGPGVARLPSAGAGVPTSGGGSGRVRFSHRDLGLREFVRFLQRSARFIVTPQPARWVSKRHHPHRRIAQRPTLRDASCKPDLQSKPGYPAAHPTRRLGRLLATSPGNARKANPT
jgi:hypothetical protein